MVYYKLILDTKRIKKDGLYTVVVRVTHNKNNTTISTGTRVRQEHWDSASQLIMKSNPNFQKLNQSVSEAFLKIQKVIHQLDDADEFSFANLKERLDEKVKPYKTNTSITFNEYSTQIINELFVINKVGNALVYQTASNRLIGFAKERKLKFKEIDYTLLEAFQRKLISQGVKQNSISNYLRTIRAIYNQAIKARLIDRTYYPFTEITIKAERHSVSLCLATVLPDPHTQPNSSCLSLLLASSIELPPYKLLLSHSCSSTFRIHEPIACLVLRACSSSKARTPPHIPLPVLVSRHTQHRPCRAPLLRPLTQLAGGSVLCAVVCNGYLR